MERNLYWVTDGTYQSAFLTTSDGVVLLDAPPTIGHNIQRAVDEIAAANGVSNTVSHLDLLAPPRRPRRRVLAVRQERRRASATRRPGGCCCATTTRHGRRTRRRSRTAAPWRSAASASTCAWHGANHSPDNIIIHLPDHDTLMLIDIVNPGWAPVYVSNLTEDIPGYVEAPANALAYSWKHFIGGHLGRLGTRDDVTLHQQYMADISESSRKAIDTVDPTRYFVKYGENTLGGGEGLSGRGHGGRSRSPVIEKYTGVLAAADVFTESTTFWVMESIRLDLGYGSQVHP